MKIGEFKSSRYGVAHVIRASYNRENGPVAIRLISPTEEPLATLSVNMYKPECSEDSEELPAGCFYAKTWAENETISKEALASGLFVERPDLPQARSGFVSAPVWQLI